VLVALEAERTLIDAAMQPYGTATVDPNVAAVGG
jgi:hypothetical protein